MLQRKTEVGQGSGNGPPEEVPLSGDLREGDSFLDRGARAEALRDVCLASQRTCERARGLSTVS